MSIISNQRINQHFYFILVFECNFTKFHFFRILSYSKIFFGFYPIVKSRVNMGLHIVTLHASIQFLFLVGIRHITKIESPPLIPTPFSFENSSMKIHQGVYWSRFLIQIELGRIFKNVWIRVSFQFESNLSRSTYPYFG